MAEQKNPEIKPRGKKGGLSSRAYLRKSSSGSTISNQTALYPPATTDLTTLRSSTTPALLSLFARLAPDMSQAVDALIRVAITDQATLVAYDFGGGVNPQATQYVNHFANRLNFLASTYKNFTPAQDLRSVSESLLWQLAVYGGFAGELVLGDGYVPVSIQPIDITRIQYEQKGNRVVPFVESDGIRQYLDSPLVRILNIDQALDTPYANSPMASALAPTTWSQEFYNDLRRAFNKASLPRPSVKLLLDKVRAEMPLDIQNDTEKAQAYLKSIIDDIADRINNLNPEDALVFFDTVEVEHLSAGNISAHESAREQRATIDAQVSAGTKTLPSILGRGESANSSSVEAMLYLRKVESYQEKLNSFFSSMFTIAARLVGLDVYVEFRYADPELRPKSEVESFRAMNQSRVLEQLSLGLISDEEASIKLTGHLPIPGAPKLSGTFFRSQSGEIENPYSNTSVSGKGTNDTAGGKSVGGGKTQPKSNKTA